MGRPLNHTMIRAIVFDCFGVLWSDALSDLFAQHTNNNPEMRTALQYLGHQADTGHISNALFWRQLANLMTLSPETCRQLVDAKRVPNELLFRLIDELRQTYAVGLLSNAGSDIWDYITPDRRKLFAACVISAEEGIAKPDHRIFQVLCERLQVKPQQVLFIDDSLINCVAAEKLGMQTIHYRPNTGVEQILRITS